MPSFGRVSAPCRRARHVTAGASARPCLPRLAFWSATRDSVSRGPAGHAPSSRLRKLLRGALRAPLSRPRGSPAAAGGDVGLLRTVLGGAGCVEDAFFDGGRLGEAFLGDVRLDDAPLAAAFLGGVFLGADPVAAAFPAAVFVGEAFCAATFLGDAFLGDAPATPTKVGVASAGA